MKAEMATRTALGLDERSPFVNFVMGELLTDEAVFTHHYTDRKKFAEAIPYLQKSRDGATVPEIAYEALFARAKAGQGGQGDFEEAAKVLTAMEQPPRKPSYLIQWVHGEMLYNRAAQTPAEKEPLLTEALGRLRQARSLHACGARSDVINDLIVRIERELVNEHPEKKVIATSEAAVVLPTDRSVSDSRQSLKNVSTDWNPVCPGWQKSDYDPAAPLAPDPTFVAVLPVFDATH